MAKRTVEWFEQNAKVDKHFHGTEEGDDKDYDYNMEVVFPDTKENWIKNEVGLQETSPFPLLQYNEELNSVVLAASFEPEGYYTTETIPTFGNMIKWLSENYEF